MALLSVDEIIAIPKGATPTYDPLNSMGQHLKIHEDDISSLVAGSPPGWAGAIDTRWALVATGTDAYSATPAGSPGSGDNMSDSMYFMFKFINANTSTSVTMDFGTADSPIDIKKVNKAGAVIDLVVGDITANMIGFCIYSAAESAMILINPVVETPFTVITSYIELKAGAYDASGAVTYYCDLPLLSTHPEGPAGDIEFYISEPAWKGIYTNPLDPSNPGKEIFQGSAFGDLVKIRKIDGDWVRLEYKAKLEVVLTMTGTDSISAGGSERLFDSSYSQTSDPADMWKTTPDQYVPAFDSKILVMLNPLVNGFQDWTISFYNATTTINEVQIGTNLHDQGASVVLDVKAGDSWEFWATNHGVASNFTAGNIARIQVLERLD